MMQSINQWLTNNKIDWSKVILPIVVILGAMLFFQLIKTITKRLFKASSARMNNTQRRQRVDTIRTLVVSIEKYVVIFVAIVIILSIFGVNVTSMVAGLGIMTAIIGLAFQDLAKDIIAGISLATENQFDVGDNVEIHGFRGNVISLGLKTTKIMSYKGNIKCIANRDITEVTNYSDKDSLAEVNVGVAYKHKSEEVEKAFDMVRENLAKNTMQNPALENSLGEMVVNGITDFGDSAIMWRVSMPCKANTAIGIERAMRREIKSVFDKQGIEIPFPQVVVANAKK
jgi:small conductance mechanosensitive channel